VKKENGHEEFHKSWALAAILLAALASYLHHAPRSSNDGVIRGRSWMLLQAVGVISASGVSEPGREV